MKAETTKTIKAEQATRTKKTEASKEKLLRCLLDDKGLKVLIDCAAEELDNPLLVVDPTYHYAAHAGFNVADDDTSAFARVVRTEQSDESIADEGINYIISQGIDEELARTAGPVIRHNDIYELDTMTQAITAHGVSQGRVMAIAHNHAFTAEDKNIFSFLAKLLAQELQKGGFLSIGNAQAGPYFLGRLLDDVAPNPIATKRRMDLIGFKPLDQRFIVVLKPKEGLFDARGANSVRGQLAAFLHHGLATHYDGALVALITRNPTPQLGKEDEAILARIAAANNLYVGISNAFSQVTDARAHYAQACAAIQYGSTYTKILEDTGVYRYCEYVPMEMLDICNDHMNLICYCHPAIWVLYQHDQEHGSELVETLYAYMQNCFNTARTAALLSLHKNTLLYRLGRIKEITGNDLMSGEDLFLFHLSIRTLIYLDFIEMRTKPATGESLHAEK